MTRYDYNKLILERLAEYLQMYPDIRFGQALINLKIVEYTHLEDAREMLLVKDPFNEESLITYKKLLWTN